MRKLTLINPRFPESFWSYKWLFEKILSHKRALNPPLGLATLAALCPDDWEIEIIDENIDNLPLRPDADVVGICGMGVQFERQKELLSYYRSRGYFVVAGGSYASLCPELYTDLSDCIVSGEAEYIWPEFCVDFARGKPKKIYQETGTVSLADSPIPRFDLIKMDRYVDATIQFSRGCPFECEFCDIIVMFGRTPRTKPLEQIGKELDELRKLNVKKVFFTDDNLIGNKLRAKELFRFLIDYQKKHNHRFHFGTEASINLAYDDELLSMFKEAGFEWVFIGIESPEQKSLEETGKVQNLKEDILSSVRKIYACGIDVIAGFIVGFDNDTTDTFERQYQFILDSGIQAAMIGLLSALPRTPLYERLKRENRLATDRAAVDNSKLVTNVVPKNMSYEEMIEGYRTLHYRLFEDRAISKRIRNKVGYLAVGELGEYSLGEAAKLMKRFIIHGLLPGGPRRIFHFLRSLPFGKPALLPQVVTDWVVGLSTRDYIERHFAGSTAKDSERIRSCVEKLQKWIRERNYRESLRISLGQSKDGASSVSISMNGLLETESFKSVVKNLERLLKTTRASVVFNIQELNHAQVETMQKLLSRLSRYGDRIQLRLDEHSRRILSIDSSIFHLSLPGT